MLKRFSLFFIVVLLSIYPVFADQGGSDSFGHMWTDSDTTVSPSIEFNWINAQDGVQLYPDFQGYFDATFLLPFNFSFYGKSYDSIYVSEAGWFSFEPLNDIGTFNYSIPTGGSGPNDIIVAPYWDFLDNDLPESGVFVKVIGTAPNRKVVIEWDVIDRPGSGVINFEAILFEHNNIIKFQYNTISSSYNGGGNATIGIQGSTTDGTSYSYNTIGSVSEGKAILFHNRELGPDAETKIYPVTAEAGAFETFHYTFYDIDNVDPDSTLGKADRFAIANPFAAAMTVTGIKINSGSAFIQNSTSKPTESGFATWTYNTTDDSLIIQTSHFEVIDSLRVSFVQSMPNTTSTGNSFPGTYDAVLDSTTVQTSSTTPAPSVEVTAAEVAYYAFDFSTPQTVEAGVAYTFTITAYDKYDNVVPNNGTIVLSTPGSGSASFSTGTSVNFSGNSSISNIEVTDTEVGEFGIRAVNDPDGTISGESEIITIIPAAASDLQIVSSQNPIRVGTDRLLQVRLVDEYGNPRAGESVTFTRTQGNGYFGVSSNADTVVNTNVDGIAEALYTASTSIVYGSDNIDVESGPVTNSISMNLLADAVAYYEFDIPGNLTREAGQSVAYVVTARDQYGNRVLNSGDASLTTPGSTTAFFNVTSPLSFTDSTESFTVTDNTAGSFAVRIANDEDGSVNGESGLITVNPTSLNYVIIRSEANNSGDVVDTFSMTTDETYTFYAAGYDQYNNYIGDVNVNWSTNGTLESASATNTNKFTFSPSVAGGSGQVVADHATATDDATGTISVGVGVLAELRIQTVDGNGGAVLTNAALTTDQTLTMYAVGYDADGNYLGAASTPANWTLNGLTGTLDPANPTNYVDFSPTASGSGSITASANSDPSVSDISGTITVTAGAISYVTIRSEANNAGSEVTTLDLTTDDRYTFYAAGYDQYDNYIGDVNVNWSTNGTLESASATNTNKFTFSPAVAGGSGQVVADHATATDDVTGTISVGVGVLAELRIQTVDGNGGAVLTNAALTTDQTLTMYAVGYDADGNYLGVDSIMANWSLNGLTGFLAPANPTHSVTFSPTLAGNGSISATSEDNSSISDISGSITVTAGAISYVTIRSEANNAGSEVTTLDLTTDDRYTFYAAGYDQYDNYIEDVNVNWSTNGTLESASATNTNKFTFSPSVAGGSGQVVADHATATDDATGTISVGVGALAQLYIQTVDGSGGNILVDQTLTTDETLDIFAVGYDADGNYLGTDSVLATWSITGLSGSITPSGSQHAVTFDPTGVSTGSIRATSVDNPSISDVSGSISVTAGAIASVIIRTEANGGGQARTDTSISLNVGQTLTLYAAGYDSEGNFAGNAIVDWSTTGSLSGLSPNNTDTYVISLSPTQPGSGLLQTSGSYPATQTGTISVSSGQLARIEIRTATGGGGSALQDHTAQAGASLELFAAGYDIYNNYLSDIVVDWSVVGDPIGAFRDGDFASTNTIDFTTVNTSSIRISYAGPPALTDYSGVIKVTPGAPATLAYVSSDSLSGQAGSTLPDSIGIRVFDAFGNRVPNVAVNWNLTDPSGELTPASDFTDTQGVSRSKWKLKSTTGPDSVYAIVADIPDTLTFRANVLESSANSMARWDDGNNPAIRTGTVRTQLPRSFVIEVVDSLDNPVPNVSITFGVTNYPVGGSDFEFENPSGLTGQDGLFQTRFTPGSKAGNYLITAYNEQLLNSGNLFFTVTAAHGTAANLVFVTEDGLTDTVGTTHGDSVRVRVEDAFENIISNATVNWTPSGTGSVNPAASASNSSGVAATEWTLGQTVGTETLTASNATAPNAILTANLIAGPAFAVLPDSGNFRTSVAGGNQVLNARVEDVFGNVVGGRNVRFQTVSTGGFLSKLVSTTDANGLAQTTYTSPDQRDTSLVRAYIAGIDTALFELYGIRYVSGSLDPSVIGFGDTASFYISVSNPGPDTIELDTANTTFSFANNYITATLDSPLTISSTPVRLKFRPVLIDTNISAGNHTPTIDFAGLNTYSGLNGKLRTDPGELSLEPVQIEYVRVPAPKAFPRGTVVQPVLMNVSNSGNYTVTIDEVNLTFSPAGYNFQPALTTPITELAPGEERTLQFTITLPANAPADTFIVDGYISCTCTGSGATLDDQAANQNDYVVVTEAINLAYSDFTPKQVSENQNVEFQVLVNNSGDYDILLNRTNTRLEFGSQSFQLTNNQALEANTGNNRLYFAASNISLTAAAGPFAGTLYLQGTENGNAIYDTLYTADGITNFDSLTVQTIAALEFLSVELSDTSVRQGQTGESITVRFQNTGQADAVIRNAGDVTFTITSAPATYTLTSQQAFPFRVSGNTIDSLVYSVRVAADAATGIDSFTVDIDYEDENSGLITTLTDPNYFDSWEIFSPGSISITSVQSDFDSISTGQENIPVVVRIRNEGQTAVRVDSILLKLSRGFYVPASLRNYSSKILTAAEADTFNLFVDVLSNSVTGTATLNATAYGVITGDLSAIEDTQADTTDSWLIQRAANIIATNNTPSQISRLQDITPVVTVRNSGEARLIIDETLSYIEAAGAPGFRRGLLSATTIEGGERDVELTFGSGQVTIAPANYALNLYLYGTENGAAFADTIALPNNLIVQSPAVMVIDSIVAIPENISRNLDTTVTVYVSNTGEADLLLNALTISPYGAPASVTPTLPSTISGGTSAAYQAAITIPAAADTGLITLDAGATGQDANSGSAVNATNAVVTDSWNVFTPPVVSVTAITSTYSVVQFGQSGIPVQITIRNGGGSPVVVNSFQLNEQIGLYSHIYPPLPFVVQAHSDTTITDLVTVLDNSATGVDNLVAQLNYTNSYSGQSSDYTSSASLTWQIITGQTDVRIVSVQTSQKEVSQGQTGENVRVRIENKGGSPATINTITLTFNNGNSNYNIQLASLTPALPNDLAGGANRTYTIPITINRDATVGSDTVYASANYTETVSMDVRDIIDSTITDSWTVQERPSVTIDSVTITPTLASTGQNNLRASVIISNAAGTYRADAQIDTVDLRFSSGGTEATSQFDIFRLSTPSLPLVLQPGRTSRFDFNVNVSDTTRIGNYEVNGYVVSQDLNDGVDSLTSTTTNPGSLQVVASGALTVNSVQVIPDTVSQGQTHARIYVDYQNNGGSAVEIRSSSLTFSPLPDGFTPQLISGSTPFTVTGGQRDTLIYAITIPNYQGRDSVSVTIRGLDLNSSETVSVTAVNAASFLMQLPADVNWVAGSTAPNASQQDTTVQFTLRVSNGNGATTGEATVELDSTTTTLNLEGTAITIPLSGTSDQIIQPNPALSNLVFRPQLITGIAEGEYPLILTIHGTSNGAVYTKTMDAGVFAFGDSLISITSVAITNNRDFLQGDTGLEVVMIVSNNGEPLAIDQAIDQTTLLFRDPVSGALRNADILNLQRTDTLTTLRSVATNTLRFSFDLSLAYPVGLTDIYGQISLDNNQVVKESSTSAELNVQTAGNASYADGTLSPDTITARQNVSYRAGFVNTGGSDVNLSQATSYLAFESQVIDTVFLAGKFTVSGNDTTTLIYEALTIPTGLTPGSYNVNWAVNGSLSNGTPYSNSGTIIDGLQIISPATIVVTNTTIDPAEVNQGQTGIAVSYTVENTGTSPAVISNINHIFRTSTANVSNQWLLTTDIAYPDTVAGGEVRNYSGLLFDLSTSATSGYHRSVPAVNYYDVRAPQFARTSGAVTAYDSVLVSTPGILTITSVLSAFDSISTGQQNVPVIVSIRNAGQTTVQMDSIQLNISRGAYNPASLYLLTSKQLLPAAADTFRLFVDVDAASVTGTATIDASAFGFNVNGMNEVRDFDADTTDSWLIQTAVNIAVLANAPTQISAGQNITPTVTITNNGSARLVLDPANTYVTTQTPTVFQRFITTPAVIEGRDRNLSLSFDAGAENIGAGDYPLELHLTGTENGAGYSQIIPLPANLLIQTPANMVIDSVVALAENISRATDTTVTVYVSNTGEADLLLNALTISPYGAPNSIAPTLPATIAGGASAAFQAAITIPADADTGLITLDAGATGQDGNSGAAVNAASAIVTDAWNVFTPAMITVTSIATVDIADSLVDQGQTGILVETAIRNNGGSPARINTFRLNGQIGLYTHRYPNLPVLLPAYGDTILTDTISVAQNSATGEDELIAEMNYTNLYSGKNTDYQSTESLNWQIGSGQAVVNIVSVRTSQSGVSQGQTGLSVQVRIQNTGISTSTINTLELTFGNGNSGYVIASPTPAIPIDVTGGTQQIFTIPVSINADATTGTDTVRAQLNITDSETGASFNVSQPDANGTWTVYSRPAVAIDSVRIEPAIASTGQNNLRGSIFLSNTAGVNRGSAEIDSVQLRIFSGGSNVTGQFAVTRLTTPTLPQMLQGGRTSRYDFDVDIPAAAGDGLYEITGRVVSQDPNDGLVTAIDTTANPDTLNIQSFANLAINSVNIIPETVSQGQTNARVFVDYENTGGAPVEIRSAGLGFAPDLEFSEILVSGATPFTITGGQRDTLIFSMVIPDNYNDSVFVSASISGRDLNSGATISVDTTDADFFIIQTPADVRWVAGSTIPSSAEQDTTVQFTLQVSNGNGTDTGEATVELDSTTTMLNLEGTAIDILLSGTSTNLVQANPNITDLVFRPHLITGITQGEYPLVLTIRGTSNGAPYTKTIDAGVFAFGDSLISITSVQVDPSTALQGDDNLEVQMIISNSGQPLPIDMGINQTTLLFRDPVSGASRNIQIDNLTRTDAADTLITGNSTLRFTFDLSASYPLGITNIYGQVSLDNNQIIQQSTTFAELEVLTSGSAKYVANSLSPDTVVARQRVPFTADFENTGSSDVVLDPDSTWMYFTGTGIDTVFLSGKFTVGGSEITTLSFSAVNIPAGLASGLYDLEYRVRGRLANGSPYGFDSTATGQLQIVPGATMIVAGTQIGSDRVRQGETNIPVTYSVENTGQSDAIITGLNHLFYTGAMDVSNDWLLNTTLPFPDTVRSGASKDYNLNFSLTNSAIPGFDRSEPTVNYYDLRTPQYLRQSQTVNFADSVLVLEPARIRIDSLVVIRDSNTPNAPYVNIDSTFNLRVVVSNTGADTIRSAIISILRNGQLIPDEIINLGVIPPAPDSQRVAVFSRVADNLGQVEYKVRVREARDVNNALIRIDQPTDNTELIFVQLPSQLWITSRISEPLGATDGVVSLGQEFKVRATVNRSGQSPIGSGALVLRTPPNYRIIPSAADSVRAFSVDSSEVEWTLIPTALTTGLNDSLQFYMQDVPVDSNTLNTAVVSSRENKLPVRVEEAGMVEILAFNISAPEGALDSVLTAGQKFVLTTGFTFSNNVDPQGRTAQIIMPADYSVEDSSVTALPGDNIVSVDWNMVAPKKLSGADSIYLLVGGFDANSGTQVQRTFGPFITRIVSPAQLSMSTIITGPSGATDRTVSTGQDIVLQTRIVNIGVAGFDDSGMIQATASGGIKFRQNGLLVDTLRISAFEATVYRDTLVMPEIPGNFQVTVRMAHLPADENSGDTVLVRRDLVSVGLQVVPRADLIVQLDKSTTVEDTLIRSIDQQFTVRAFVRNRGIAAVDTSRWLRLGASGMALSIDQPRKAYTVGDTVTWNITAPSSEGTGQLFVIADSEPKDVNDGLNAFRASAAASDSIPVSIRRIGNLVVQSAFLRNQVGMDSLVVSTEQDSITISADIFFDPILDAAKDVTLILPVDKGYASLDTNLTKKLSNQANTNIRWLIRASNKTSGWSPVILRATGQSASIPGLPAQVQTDTIYIRTENRARLSLALQITEPAGAVDDTLSYGQLFKLRALVANAPGVAGTIGQGTAAINLPDGFILTTNGNDGITADSQKPFTVGTPFFWWIQITDTASGSVAKTELLNLLNTKIGATSRATKMEGVSQPALDIKKLFELNDAAAGEAEIISVQLLSVPNDINSLSPAFVINPIQTKTVYLERKADILVQNTEAPVTVSTGQSFDYSVKGRIRGNLINPVAMISISPTLTTGKNEYALALGQDTTITVRLTIPEAYTGGGQDSIRVFLVGIDANTGKPTGYSPTVLNVITVQARPKLVMTKLSVDPLDDLDDDIISRGRKVIVTLKPNFAQKDNPAISWAGLTGGGSISIGQDVAQNTNDSLYFTLVDGTPATQTFTSNFESLTWTLKAPKHKDLSSIIRFRFTGLPGDANTGLSVTVNSDSNEVSIPIGVKQKTVQVALQNDKLSGVGYSNDSSLDSLMIFTIDNKFDDILHLKHFTLSFRDMEKSLFKSETLIKIFKQITVSEFTDDNKQAAKSTKLNNVLLDYPLDDSATNPLILNFPENDVINPQSSRSYLITGEYQSKTPSKSFQVVLTDLFAWDFDTSTAIAISDAYGKSLSESELFASDTISVISNNIDEDFYNYPNPFGRQYPETFFHFQVDNPPAEVKIRIFTLLGELVRTWDETVATRISDRQIRWDGKNDKGQTVLNGVYLCYIDIKPVSGGSTKRFKTKIAYIK